MSGVDNLIKELSGLSVIDPRRKDLTMCIVKVLYKELTLNTQNNKDIKMKLFRIFEGFNLDDKIDIVSELLEYAGIELVFPNRKGRWIGYYLSDDTVFGVSSLPKNAGMSFNLFDRWIYNEIFADGKGSFSFVARTNSNDYKASVNRENHQRVMHRLILELAGYNLKSRQPVDHKFGCALINTLEALRIATASQNRFNTKFYYHSAIEEIPKKVLKKLGAGVSEEELYARLVAYEKEMHGEFAYNPLTDFTNTWYTYVLYKMIKGFCTWEDLEAYNRDYILRNDPNAARYYKSILLA